jgi:ribosomal protein L9
LKRRYKFDALVLTRSTGLQGKTFTAGTVLPIYGDNRLISETEAAFLLNTKKALPADKETISAVKKQVEAADKAKADIKARQGESRLAALGKKEVTALLQRIDELEQRVEALEGLVEEDPETGSEGNQKQGEDKK